MKSDALSIALLACLSSGTCLAGSDISLTGTYVYRNDAQSLEMLGGLVCFIPDGHSAKLLPRPEADSRNAWLCFRNDAQAKALLGIREGATSVECGVQGTAKVRVAEYKSAKPDTDDIDSALLRSVSDVYVLAPVPCG